jgi:hypothetical protein
MRAYTVATAAVTLGVSRKWLDNTLSHHLIPGIIQSRQGISRQLTPPALIHIQVAIALMETLLVPLKRALELSNNVLSAAKPGDLPLSPAVSVHVDIPALSEDLVKRLNAAVEITPVPRRGRPPAKGQAQTP